MGAYRSGEGGWRNGSTGAFVACLLSFLVSMSGGAILLWWALDYHSSNGQLWMVPLGLIFFFTPIFICSSTLLSDYFLSPDTNNPPPPPPPPPPDDQDANHPVPARLSRRGDSVQDLEALAG